MQTAGQLSYIAYSEFLYYMMFGLHIAIMTAVISVWLFLSGGVGVLVHIRSTR